MKIKIAFTVIICLALISFLALYGETGFMTDRSVLMDIRIPKIIAAFFAGGLLAVSGILMQLYFQNPIAGPEVLGVSSGSLFFVALFVMAQNFVPKFIFDLGINFASYLGALIVFLFLIFFSRRQSSKGSILIIGILISSFVTSAISVLVNLSQALQVKSYLLWSQGSFRNLLAEDMKLFIFLCLIILIPIFIFKKSFYQVSIGENYARSLGVNLRLTKAMFVLIASWCVSIITTYCGPIGFVGIIAPFLTRKFLKTANLNFTLPTTFLVGAIITLFSESIITLFPSIPLSTNTILGIIGAPILVYFMYEKKDILV